MTFKISEIKNTLLQGNTLDVLKQLPDNSIDCCITSPPYYSLRAYGTNPVIWGGDPDCEHSFVSKERKLHSGRGDAQQSAKYSEQIPIPDTPINDATCTKCGAWMGELGLEPTIQLFIDHLTLVFDEVHRVLKRTGTCWIVIGDSYAGSWGDSGHRPSRTGVPGHQRPRDDNTVEIERKGHPQQNPPTSKKQIVKPKSLCNIPARLAISMTDRGFVHTLTKDGWQMVDRSWIERNQIIWHKPSCLNGSTYLYAKTQKGAAPVMLKDLVRLDPTTVKLYDGEKWNQVVNWIKNDNPQDIREIILRSGERFVCTGDHVFLTDNGTITADKLQVGTILKHTQLPDNERKDDLISEDVGWLIGIYLADGCKNDNNNELIFASHLNETERFNKVQKISKQFDAACTWYQTSENGMTIRVRSKILTGIIDTYLTGEYCYGKHLTRKAWSRNNTFLAALLQGYLEGDGSWIEKDKRWRIGFTSKNKHLEKDLRGICARLGYTFGVKKQKNEATNNAYLGEIRTVTSNHPNNKSRYEVISNQKGKKSGKFYDIVLVEEPHTFSTIGGTLVHNCMPSSAKDRFTVDYEAVFFMTKEPKYYFNQQFEPLKEESKRRAMRGRSGEGKYAEEYLPPGVHKPTMLRERPNVGYEDMEERIAAGETLLDPRGRNKRTLWTIDDDKFPDDFDYIFFFTKDKKYYFEQQLEPASESHIRRASSINHLEKRKDGTKSIYAISSVSQDKAYAKIREQLERGEEITRNKRTVWSINPQAFKEAHFACVTPDTEILTIDGWKRYTDFEWYASSPHHTLVATYNIQEKIIEYQPLSYIKEYDYDGNLVHVGNRDLDILMTPNHRNVVVKRGGKEGIIEASELNSRDSIKTIANVKYPIRFSVGVSFAELIGWVISEGCYIQANQIELYQNEGKKAQRIDRLLNNLEIPHTRTARGREYNGETKKQIVWYLKRSLLVEWMRQNIPDKQLTLQLTHLPINELRALFNGLVLGDGHTRHDDNRISFFQKSKETCDLFEIIAFKLGYHTTTSKRNDNDTYVVYCTKKDKIGIRATNGSGVSVQHVHYKGKVWCPSTPNGTWVAKRNGRVFITGNTFPETLVEPMIQAGCPPDGIVLDPFAGSGTTCIVAKKQGRDYIGIELNEAYVKMAEKRLGEML